MDNIEILLVNEPRHLGMIMDSQLNFQSHIKVAILKARRGIGYIYIYIYIYTYAQRHTIHICNDVYK